ncbi:MAG: hypothetical protein ACHQ9S_26385 [Candidatus Binatia bacterium]
MTLQDLLRTHSREAIDSIQQTKTLIDRYRRERQAALERTRQARADADAKRGVSDEQSNSVRLVQSKISEIERQLQELRSRLEERREELKRCQQEHTETEFQISEQRKRERNEHDEAEALERKVTEAEAALQRDADRLRDARRAAVSAYLDELWKHLLEHSASAQQRSVATDTRQKFEQQRHQDPELASLWEAREEWKKIVSSSAPTLVLQTAKTELARVENEINTRFPGIFDALTVDRGLAEIEELFFRQEGDAGTVWMPLPIPMAVWKAIEEGGSTLPEQVGMRLVWSIAKAVSPSTHSSEFGAQGAHGYFTTDRLPEAVIKADPVVLQLPGGGRVDLILSPFPPELAEVFGDEHFHE